MHSHKIALWHLADVAVPDDQSVIKFIIEEATLPDSGMLSGFLGCSKLVKTIPKVLSQAAMVSLPFFSSLAKEHWGTWPEYLQLQQAPLKWEGPA